MKKTTTKKTKTDEDPIVSYVRTVWRDLDGRFDKETIPLLMHGGALSVEDPAKIGDAVERLAAPRGVTDVPCPSYFRPSRAGERQTRRSRVTCALAAGTWWRQE